MRLLLKSAVERLLCFGPTRIGRRLLHGRTVVLAYHNVVPAGDAAHGDKSLHLPQPRFAVSSTSCCKTHV
jgi:hypothetical protein